MNVTLSDQAGDRALVVLGAAAEVERQEGRLPTGGEEVAVDAGTASFDVPYGSEAIVFFAQGETFLSAKQVRLGQTFGDQYRLLKIDWSKEHLTVTGVVVQEYGPDPGEAKARAEVEWGDGSPCEEIVQDVDDPALELSHTYPEPGHYSVHIRFIYTGDPRPSFTHHKIVLD